PRRQRVLLRVFDLLEAPRGGGQAAHRNLGARRAERHLHHHVPRGRQGRLILGGGPQFELSGGPGPTRDEDRVGPLPNLPPESRWRRRSRRSKRNSPLPELLGALHDDYDLSAVTEYSEGGCAPPSDPPAGNRRRRRSRRSKRNFCSARLL